MPGMGEVMDGAMQQAPQPGRQEKSGVFTMPASVIVLGNCGVARYSLRVKGKAHGKRTTPFDIFDQSRATRANHLGHPAVIA